MSESNTATTAPVYRARILAVLVHIQKHLDDDLDLDTLAAIAHFSSFHFHRIFSGLLGEGVKEHVRRLRLERAAHRLKFADDPIVRVAFDAGYQAHESFTRAFTAMFEMSPSQFRAQHRSVDYPPGPNQVHYTPSTEVLDMTAKIANVHVEIATFAARRVAFIRHIGPYTDVGPTWGRLMAWAAQRGLLGKSEFFGLCYDDPDVTPADKLRYDACLVVKNDVRGEGEVGVQDVEGGDFAVTVHTGPYSTLGGTYAALCAQLVASGARALGDPPALEFYLNDPRTTPPAALRTKICLRIV